MNQDRDNVTFRNKYRSNSVSDLSKSSLFEDGNMSLPQTSFTCSQDIMLNEEIGKLKNYLKSAETEIENLSLENQKLKCDLEKSQKLIETYKVFKFSDTPSTPISARRRKKPRKALTEKNERLQFCTQVNNSVKDGPANLDKQNKEKTQKNTEAEEPDKQLNIDKDDSSDPKGRENMEGHHPDKQLNIDKDESRDAKRQEEITNIGHENQTRVSQETIIHTQEAKIDTEIKKTCKDIKKKVIIIGDQQARGLQKALQILLGSQHLVTCFWKSGAKVRDLTYVEKNEISALSNKDFVIILGGMNEVNPFEFKTHAAIWLHSIEKANVIVCEIPHNKNLREYKLNYELKLICNQFQNVSYLELNYSRFIPDRMHFTKQLSRSLLRKLLQIDYTIKMNQYTEHINLQKKHKETAKVMINMSTQTNNDTKHIELEPEIKNINKNLNSNTNNDVVINSGTNNKTDINLNDDNNDFFRISQ